MPSHLVGKNLLLSLVAMLEQLLYHIISEYISHQLNGVWLYLSEETFFLITVGRLQLLLDEA